MRAFLMSFRTQTDAIRFETNPPNISGRLSPVPSSLRVGCGIAWIGPEEIETDAIRKAIDLGIDFGTATIIECGRKETLNAK